jgi:RNA polymerase sigma factor (sigma-70 family)
MSSEPENGPGDRLAPEQEESGEGSAAGRPRLSPWVRKARSGDPGAIAHVVAELGPGVLRAVRALVGRDHPDVEDLTQDVLLAVVAGLPDFRGESTLLHFAVRIAARKSVLVRRRRRSVADWLQTFWRTEHPLREGPASAHDEARGDRQRALLRCLLSELPDAQAEALMLRVVCGHSIEEISAVTQTPLNTVRSRLRLAKEALRRRIEEEPRWAELGEEAP